MVETLGAPTPVAAANLQHRCGPCGGFFASHEAVQQHHQTCDEFQRIIATQVPSRTVPAPPGGPRGVRHVYISGIGVLPADDSSQVNRRLRRGRPPLATKAQMRRRNTAVSVYGTYLRWRSLFELLRWVYRHTPPKMFHRCFEPLDWTVTDFLVTHPGASLEPSQSPREIVVGLLAAPQEFIDSDGVLYRYAGLSRSRIRHLIDEGAWWDALTERWDGAGWTMRAQVEVNPDALHFLRRCQQRLGRRRQLNVAQTAELLEELRGMPEWSRLNRMSVETFKRQRRVVAEALAPPT